MKIDVQELARVLLQAPFHYIGITAYPPNPAADPPCAVINERSLHSFDYALDGAREYWQHAAEFVIVGSNAVVKPQTPTQMARGELLRYPPGFQRLQSPVTLFQFAG